MFDVSNYKLKNYDNSIQEFSIKFSNISIFMADMLIKTEFNVFHSNRYTLSLSSVSSTMDQLLTPNTEEEQEESEAVTEVAPVTVEEPTKVH